jgi:hypothetical protein
VKKKSEERDLGAKEVASNDIVMNLLTVTAGGQERKGKKGKTEEAERHIRRKPTKQRKKRKKARPDDGGEDADFRIAVVHGDLTLP